MLTLTGCSTGKAYSADAESDKSIAIVRGIDCLFAIQCARITEVDEYSFGKDSEGKNRVAMLPGHHRVSFMFWEGAGFLSAGVRSFHSFPLDAEARHVYQIHYDGRRWLWGESPQFWVVDETAGATVWIE